MTGQRIAWFDTLTVGDVPRVGGKNASLGEVVRTLNDKGMRVPDGFATTAEAFREYVSAYGIDAKLPKRLEALKSGTASLHETREAIRRLCLDGEYPEPAVHAIRTAKVATTRKERQTFVLDDAEILELGRWAVIIENHYGRPMDMEWAKDGETGDLYMAQARPETAQSSRQIGKFKTYQLKAKGNPILTGSVIGEAIATGQVCTICSAADIDRFRDGAILVTGMTDSDWVPIMKRAAGFITDHGGTTSHDAIISRELGVRHRRHKSRHRTAARGAGDYPVLCRGRSGRRL